jgi:hypothetical protein
MSKMGYAVCSFQSDKYRNIQVISTVKLFRMTRDEETVQVPGTEQVSVAVKALMIFLKTHQTNAVTLLRKRIGHSLSNPFQFIFYKSP